MDHDDRLHRWERASATPLLVASLLFLGCYALLVLDSTLSDPWRSALRAVMFAAWLAFLADYLVRLRLSPSWWRFVRTRWLDLVVLLLPLLRPLRVVQSYARRQEHRGRPSRMTLEAQVITYTSLTALLLGFTGSLAVYQVERTAPGANIRTFGDSVWYTCSTLTSVGYGDVYPITPRGRLIGVGMMLTGLGLFGSVVSTFSSWLVNRFRRVQAREAGDRES